MTKLLSLTTFVVLCTNAGFSQNNNVGINTNTPDQSAILHLEADDKGLLVPRLTSTQRDAIASPATGLIIYNSTEDQEEIYNGNCWVPSYLEDCDDCSVDINFAQANYSLNRATNLNLSIPVNVSQTSPGGQNLPVELGVVHDFSEETEITLSQNSVSGTSVVNIDLATNVFETGGNHKLTLLTFCGGRSYARTVDIDISLCDQLVIDSEINNYDISANGSNGSNCVVVTIEENGSVRSTDPAIPAFTTGNINSNCNLGIVNKGYIFGRGGDGPTLMGQDGQDGGDAMQINCNAEIRNTGHIYGGGGSGLTVGAFESLNLGPVSFCVAIGAGGGAGIPDGEGGGDSQGNCTLLFGVWADGRDAGSFYDDNEGFAVSENFSQSLSLGPVNMTISITANGGSGGDFGEAGTSSSQPVDFGGTSLEICINIPFIGDICTPIPGVDAAFNGIANLIIDALDNSTPGEGGYAIKHSGNLNIPDNVNYQTTQLRGEVGN